MDESKSVRERAEQLLDAVLKGLLTAIEAPVQNERAEALSKAGHLALAIMRFEYEKSVPINALWERLSRSSTMFHGSSDPGKEIT